MTIKREKVFGQVRAVALRHMQKLSIKARARAYNIAHKQPGQHQGPLTAATLRVLDALLEFEHGGACFPSYEGVGAKAHCCRSTVHLAINALEAAGLLTWLHRLTGIWQPVRDLFGDAGRWLVIRTSNAYRFPESENPTGKETTNKSSYLREPVRPRARELAAPDSAMRKALHEARTVGESLAALRG